MGANNNYNKKIAGALKKLMKHDKDLWLKKPNENAFNSNLYRRITANPKHKLDMEYDAYQIKAIAALLANPELKAYIISETGSKGYYNPKPDIIVHQDNVKDSHGNISRDELSIGCVAESKFNDAQLSMVGKDYLKLSAYKLLWPHIKYLNLVIFPRKGTTSPKYKVLGKDAKIGNKARLREALNQLDDNEGVVLQATPYPGQINNLFSGANVASEVRLDNDKGGVSDGNTVCEFKVNDGIVSSIRILDALPEGATSIEPERVFETEEITELSNFFEDERVMSQLERYGTVKPRSIADMKYLRSGFQIKEATTDEEYDQPGLLWRNTVIITKEAGEYKLLLQNCRSSLDDMVETESSYSDNPKSKGKVFKSDTDPKNGDVFLGLLELNIGEIDESAERTTKKILRERTLRSEGDQNLLNEAEEKHRAMVELFLVVE